MHLNEEEWQRASTALTSYAMRLRKYAARRDNAGPSNREYRQQLRDEARACEELARRQP